MRPWHLSDGQTTPEWNIAPYSTHTTLSIPSVGSNARLFYSSDQNSATTVLSSWLGTGVVQITDSSGKAAYVVESGLAIAANVGTAELGKTALDFQLRTFLDGGNYTGNAHIVQVPLIKVYVDSLNNQYYQPSNVNIVVDGPVTTGTPLILSGFATISSGPTNNIWYRFPGITSSIANYYTEAYPHYSQPLTASTYSETSGGNPLVLDLNLKYSQDGGHTWSFIQDNVSALQGVLDTSGSHLIQSSSFPVTYQWPVPAGSFPQGDYFIMAEAYRHAYPLDYCYHVLDISINR